MDNLINRIEEIPLSGVDLNDMSRALGQLHTKSILYEELEEIQKIDDLFNDVNTVYILLNIQGERMGTVGHWVALIKNKNGLVYYDPYALALSQDIELTGEKPWLEILLSKEPSVDYNIFRHQKFKDETQTCGRHTVIRGLFWFMTNAEYNRLVMLPVLNFVKDPDTFAALLTGFLGPSDRVITEFFKSRV